MNAQAKLKRVRDLVKSKMLELQPFAGEEMNLPHNNPRRDSFIDGERTLASQVLAILENEQEAEGEPVEEEMVLGR